MTHSSQTLKQILNITSPYFLREVILKGMWVVSISTTRSDPQNNFTPKTENLLKVYSSEQTRSSLQALWESLGPLPAMTGTRHIFKPLQLAVQYKYIHRKWKQVSSLREASGS